MAERPRMYLGGHWADAADGETLDSVDPATGVMWASIHELGSRTLAELGTTPIHINLGES